MRPIYMKTVSCKDIKPDSDCDFEATGPNIKDVVNKMAAHVKKEHTDAAAGMSDGEIRAMIEPNVHDA